MSYLKTKIRRSGGIEKISLELKQEQLNQRPPTDFDRIKKLSRDPAWEVRAEVAKLYPLPPVVIKLLGRDPHLKVRRLIAMNRSTPPRTLARLASDREPEVRAAAARNPFTPVPVLQKLARGDAALWVARNKSCDLETLKTLAEFAKPAVLVGLASNPRLTEELFERLAGSEYDNVRAVVASNGYLPLSAAKKLIKDKSVWVLSCLANNPRIAAPELLVVLYRNHCPDVRAAVAVNPRTPVRVLARLINDRAPMVVRNVVYNKKTTREIIEKIKPFRSEEIDQALAGSFLLPVETLEKLYEKYGTRRYFRWLFAWNRLTPPDILRKIEQTAAAGATLDGLREEAFNLNNFLSRNPNLPADLAEKLFAHPHENVRSGIASRKDLPEKMLLTLSLDESSMVRRAVADNPAAPASILLRLAGDEQPLVRAAAEKRL